MSDSLYDFYWRAYSSSKRKGDVYFTSKMIDQRVFRQLNQVSLSIEDATEKCRVFNRSYVSPYECDIASESLLKLNMLAKELCESRAIDNIPHCQTLLLLFYNVEHLTKTTRKPIDQLRLVCLEHSEQKDELHMDIQELVEDLLDTSQLIDAEITKLYESTPIFATPSMPRFFH